MKVYKNPKIYFYGNRQIGFIDDEEMYEKVKSEELGWSENKKEQITHYIIPASVFNRLLKLDQDKVKNEL